ncbi:MAG: hypothetical protein A2343_01855, partial [Candidatus Moranbacteria bacterium RIFOXYB12_FULL_35_8]
KIREIFERFQAVKLAYFFGSRARGEAGPMSDYDFAVYLDEKDKQKMFDIKFRLMDELSRVLKTEKVDLVILNTIESPEIKYEIIRDGQLICKKEPYKILVEPHILQEYFDFLTMLRKYNLTKA